MSDRDGHFLIRVAGDSLSMPRISEQIPYQQTYAELLRRRIEVLGLHRSVNLYNRSRGGATVGKLLEDFKCDSFAFGNPGGDLFIIQSGIVDCAPRPISRVLRRGVGMLPGRAKTRAIRFLHDHRAALLKHGKVFRETPPEKFEKIYASWLGQACGEFRWVYAVNIAPTNPYIEERSPGFGASVRQYNSIISSVCQAEPKRNVRLINVHDEIMNAPNGVSQFINRRDGHHITREGHQLYADLIFTNLLADFALV